VEPGEHTNTVLRAMGGEALERLRLRPVKFDVGYELEYPGKPIERVFFVETGMASITTTFADGEQVEVGMFGFEGIVGVSALMGTKRSLNRVYTQIAGTGFWTPVESARLEFARGGVFQTLALGYVQSQLLQAMQSAGCNARHSLEQRLARWLLICADRANSSSFELSQEYLALMLGATRSTVSGAAGALKASGLVSYQRGKLRILDAAGLEKRACECYLTIKNHLDNCAEFDTSFDSGAPWREGGSLR